MPSIFSVERKQKEMGIWRSDSKREDLKKITVGFWKLSTKGKHSFLGSIWGLLGASNRKSSRYFEMLSTSIRQLGCKCRNVVKVHPEL